MAASFQFSESNGAGETIHDGIANCNFGSNDSYEIVPLTYPIIAGTNSFSKYIRGKFGGSWTDISNMKFWKSAGAYVAGELIKAAANVTYATPTATATGDSTIPISVGTALALNSAEGENHIEYGASGVSGYTAYIRLQLQTTVDSTPAGSVNQKTLTLQYDEI